MYLFVWGSIVLELALLAQGHSHGAKRFALFGNYGDTSHGGDRYEGDDDLGVEWQKRTWTGGQDYGYSGNRWGNEENGLGHYGGGGIPFKRHSGHPGYSAFDKRHGDVDYDKRHGHLGGQFKKCASMDDLDREFDGKRWYMYKGEGGDHGGKRMGLQKRSLELDDDEGGHHEMMKRIHLHHGDGQKRHKVRHANDKRHEMGHGDLIMEDKRHGGEHESDDDDADKRLGHFEEWKRHHLLDEDFDKRLGHYEEWKRHHGLYDDLDKRLGPHDEWKRMHLEHSAEKRHHRARKRHYDHVDKRRLGGYDGEWKRHGADSMEKRHGADSMEKRHHSAEKRHLRHELLDKRHLDHDFDEDKRHKATGRIVKRHQTDHGDFKKSHKDESEVHHNKHLAEHIAGKEELKKSHAKLKKRVHKRSKRWVQEIVRKWYSPEDLDEKRFNFMMPGKDEKRNYLNRMGFGKRRSHRLDNSHDHHKYLSTFKRGWSHMPFIDERSADADDIGMA